MNGNDERELSSFIVTVSIIVKQAENLAILMLLVPNSITRTHFSAFQLNGLLHLPLPRIDRTMITAVCPPTHEEGYGQRPADYVDGTNDVVDSVSILIATSCRAALCYAPLPTIASDFKEEMICGMRSRTSTAFVVRG